jgi:hypothetical protein
MVSSQDWPGILDSERITSVRSFCWLLRKGVGIVADATGATVIFLRSYPAWVAAQRRKRERDAAIRRHPSFPARKRAAASGGDVIRDFKVYSSTDTPA